MFKMWCIQSNKHLIGPMLQNSVIYAMCAREESWNIDVWVLVAPVCCHVVSFLFSFFFKQFGFTSGKFLKFLDFFTVPCTSNSLLPFHSCSIFCGL